MTKFKQIIKEGTWKPQTLSRDKENNIFSTATTILECTEMKQKEQSIHNDKCLQKKQHTNETAVTFKKTWLRLTAIIVSLTWPAVACKGKSQC